MNGSVEDFDDVFYEGKLECFEDVVGFLNGIVVFSECCNISFLVVVVVDLVFL